MKDEGTCVCIEIYGYFDWDAIEDKFQLQEDLENMFYFLVCNPKLAISFVEHYKKVKELVDGKNN